MARHVREVLGTCVALVFSEYDFADRETGERVSGTSCTLHLVERFDSEPLAVKVPVRRRDELTQDLDFGVQVRAQVGLFARGDRIEASLQDLEVLAPTGA